MLGLRRLEFRDGLMRFKMDWATERWRLQESRVQPRPQNELNSRPRRFAANRNNWDITLAPSPLIAPNTTEENLYGWFLKLSSYFLCFWCSAYSSQGLISLRLVLFSELVTSIARPAARLARKGSERPWGACQRSRGYSP